MSLPTSHAGVAALATPALGTRAQAALAMLLGLAVIAVVGFLQVDVVHNAAHDLRHANGFPCH